MQFAVSLKPPPSANDFAPVTLEGTDGVLGRLKIGFSELRGLGATPSETILDFFLLAQVVYALDRLILRERAPDNWTRTFSLTLPVSDPDRWNRVKGTVQACLAFLSGDLWDVAYAQRETDLVVPSVEVAFPAPVGAVSLFSGGLDSLVGVIDFLETHEDEDLILVGHHDPRIAGPLSDQAAVLRHLDRHYPGRTRPILTSAGSDSGDDTTLRSRSLTFIALGLYAADTVPQDTPLLIPENGNIALNVPLTPSRAGSCSTRTVHPRYLELLGSVLGGLGIQTPIVNPLEAKTKGECLEECLNQEALKEAARASASCAKRGHKRTWLRKNAKQCGRCMPCIYRRAALHRVGLDDETYGRDICAGEVALESEYGYADDFRACVSFLRRNLPPEETAILLLQNGSLEASRLPGYAGLVSRAMEEIRVLLRDKALDSIKRRAGLQPPLGEKV